VDRRAFFIRADVEDEGAAEFAFPNARTMYGGKAVAAGDVVYVFASESGGGRGLIARGVAVSATSVPRRRGLERQTPRVSIVVRRTATPKRAFVRNDVKEATAWKDGRPETELNFKFFRQATNKIGAISDEAVRFLDAFF
jgi:hypothetical protein